jgi:hypothetical protein
MIETIYCQCLSRPDCQDWVDRLQEREPGIGAKGVTCFCAVQRDCCMRLKWPKMVSHVPKGKI